MKEKKKNTQKSQSIWFGGTTRTAIKKRVQETLEKTDIYEQIP